MGQDTIYLSVPITKSTEDPDGSIYVEGIATNDTLDFDDQIVDRPSALKGLTTWFSDWANVRQMHSESLPPGGTAVQMEDRPEGIWFRVKVYEPGAVLQVKNGGYKAFSVGMCKFRIQPDPVAKRGRIFPETFHEISLVDFPANPTAKFQLAKRASTAETSEITEINKIVSGDDTLNKRDFDSGVGGGTDRDKIPAGDFAGPNRTYPIVTPQDVADAAKLVGKAANPDAVKARIISIAKRKGASFVAKLPASWKDGGSTSDKTVTEPAYHLRRLHDGICPAYTELDALAAHPTLSEGLAKSVPVEFFAEDVHKALSPERFADLTEASARYSLACELHEADDRLLAEGMEKLRKAFDKELEKAGSAPDYPNSRPNPTEMSPGLFHRGFLAAACSTTPSGKPRIPLTSHVPRPSDFQRGPLTDGQQRTSPANKDASEKAPRHYYTNDARSAAASALVAMHNYIADSHPSICALDQPGGTDDATVVADGVTTDWNNKDDSAPTATTVANKKKDDGEGNGKITKSMTKIFDDKAAEITKAFVEKIASLSTVLDDALERLSVLESAPDPTDVTIRNSTALTSLKRAPQTPEEDEGSAEATQALVKLAKMARHPDSTVSVPALTKMMDSYGPEVVAKLLGG